MWIRSPLYALVTVVALVAGAGCGKDGDELLGVWQVTAHSRNQAGCDAEGAAVAEPAYIKFIAGSFFGQDYVEYVDCTDAAGAACDGPGGLFGLLYAESIDGGMRAAIHAASGSAADCLLSSTVSDAVVSGATIRIAHRLLRGPAPR